jgi:CheY-like chemotaxis protein
MHLITHRSLKKHVESLLSPYQRHDSELQPFLRAIDNAFQALERENAFARRLITLNDSRIFLMLAKENEKRELALKKLINTVSKINVENTSCSANKQYLEAISNFIENQIKQNEAQIQYFLSTRDNEESLIERTTPLDIQQVAGLNVLIVDDYNINIKIVGKLLKRWNINYCFAENGLQAIEKLELASYNLILMDLEMDKMDGFTASEIIRTKYPNLPIFALTSYSDDNYRKKAFMVGINEYITKPVIPNKLLKKIIAYCIENNTNH